MDTNMQQPGKINATYLNTFFNESDTTTATFLAVMVASLKASTAAEVNTAVRDWSKGFAPSDELKAKAAKGDEGAKKELARLEAKRKTAQNRGGDVKALKAAMDSGFNPEPGKGYHATIAASRAWLAERGLGTNGRPIVDAKTKATARHNKAVALATYEKVAGGDVSKMTPESFVEGEAVVAKETARRLAQVIVCNATVWRSLDTSRISSPR